MLSLFARTQSLRALSSPEAEFYGVCSAAAELIYIAGLLEFVGYIIDKTIESDASSAISIASREGCGGIRHLEARSFWVQSHVQSGNIELRKAPGAKNLPDAGAKHVKREVLERCCQEVGLRR